MLQLHLLKSNNMADLATEFLLKPVIFSVKMSLFWKISILKISLSSSLNLLSANLQKWSMHSNYSSATFDEFFECVWPFCGVGVERVKGYGKFEITFILWNIAIFWIETSKPCYNIDFSSCSVFGFLVYIFTVFFREKVVQHFASTFICPSSLSQ